MATYQEADEARNALEGELFKSRWRERRYYAGSSLKQRDDGSYMIEIMLQRPLPRWIKTPVIYDGVWVDYTYVGRIEAH